MAIQLSHKTLVLLQNVGDDIDVQDAARALGQFHNGYTIFSVSGGILADEEELGWWNCVVKAARSQASFKSASS